jgi:hypothetical protein
LLKKNSNSRYLSIDKEYTLRDKSEINFSKRTESTNYLPINIPTIVNSKYKNDSINQIENSLSSNIADQNETISHELINHRINLRGNSLDSPVLRKKKLEFNPKQSSTAKKTNDLISIFKSEGIVYQSFPTIEDICNKNHTLLHNNKNEINMRKVIKMRNYDNYVLSLSKTSKILNRQLNGKHTKSSFKSNNPVNNIVDRKKENFNNKSISLESGPRQSLLITSLPYPNKAQMKNRFSSVDFDKTLNVVPPIIFDKKNHDNNELTYENSGNISPNIKRKQKFLEIYRSSLNKEDTMNKLKKKKNLPLEKYQENLVNAVSEEIDREKLVSLIAKFGEIRCLDNERKSDLPSNRYFYDKLVNLIRTEFDYFDEDEESSNKKHTKKKDNEIKYKYKKKVKIEKNMERLKYIIPKFLYDKFNKNI